MNPIDLIKKLDLYAGKMVAFFVTIYQKTLSLDHSPLFKPLYPYGFCPLYPSCSEYSKLSLKQHGLIKGITRSAVRIVHCNPWTKPHIHKP